VASHPHVAPRVFSVHVWYMATKTISIDLEAHRALRRRGEPISTMDLLIATAAVRDEAPLVTRNVKGFERVSSLHVSSY